MIEVSLQASWSTTGPGTGALWHDYATSLKLSLNLIEVYHYKVSTWHFQ
jgi:hypothetical protein